MREKRAISAIMSAIILTSCGKTANPVENDAIPTGNEAIASETTGSDSVKTAESLIETTDTENRIVTNKPSETEKSLIYTEISNKILYEDENTSLTCGEYIDSLMNYDEFINALSKYSISGFQLADMDEDGIPELMLKNLFLPQCPSTIYFSVSPDGDAKILYNNESGTNIEGYFPVPYKLNGETVWLSEFFISGMHGESRGDSFVSLDRGIIQTNIIREHYHTFIPDDLNEYFWYDEPVSWEEYENRHDEPISKEEYEKRYEDLFLDMRPSYVPCTSINGYFTKGDIYAVTESLSEIMKEYLDSMPESDVYKNVTETILYDDGENALTAGDYIDAVMGSEELFSYGAYRLQLADIDGNGIPELILRVNAYPVISFINVSERGEVTMIPTDEQYWDEYTCNADQPEPYIKDGKTVWIARFGDGGSGSGGGGDCILGFNDGKITKEVIRSYEYIKNYDTFGYDYTYFRGDFDSPVISEEEYEKLYEDFLADAEPSPLPCPAAGESGGISSVQRIGEMLFEITKKYIESEK